MGPISRGLTRNRSENSDTNEISYSHEPPPSTMAAQLIKNLTTAPKPTRHVEQDDLQKLMSEVSSLENSLLELSDIDARLEHKHKLIYVFARAVLERLAKDDPFVNTTQQLINQTSEALDVFISTINELPSVLAYVTPIGSNLHGRGQEPLWLWLFPRVLIIFGHKQCESLTEKIKDFFYISCQAVSRSPKLWGLSSLFFGYLKDCAASKCI